MLRTGSLKRLALVLCSICLAGTITCELPEWDGTIYVITDGWDDDHDDHHDDDDDYCCDYYDDWYGFDFWYW